MVGNVEFSTPVSMPPIHKIITQIFIFGKSNPAPPCPTLPLPPAKKKERPACRRQDEDGRERGEASMPAVLGGRGRQDEDGRERGEASMPAVLGGRAPSHRGALARLWRAVVVLTLDVG